jgi:hypothetical protein
MLRLNPACSRHLKILPPRVLSILPSDRILEDEFLTGTIYPIYDSSPK